MGIARTIARNTLFNFITNASEYAITFVVGIILARGLGTREYGLYSYMLWILGLAQLAIGLGIGDMLMRFVPEALGRGQVGDVRSLIRFGLLLRVTTLVIGCMVILFLPTAW